MSLLYSLIENLNKRIFPHISQEALIFGIQFDITNACNLTCDHCYHAHHKNQGALTFKEWLLILDQYEKLLKKLHMLPHITLCGGEPLLCPFLILLLENIRQRFHDCELYILSNGTLIDSERAERLKKFNVYFQISLDGPDAARHDVIRGKGSFDKTLQGCRALKEQGINFHHLAVLSKRTAAWIPDFFKLPAVSGATTMNFTRFIIEGNARKLIEAGKDYPLTSLELKEAYKQILYYSQTTNVPTGTAGPLWHLIDENLGSPSTIGFGIVVGYRGEFKVSSRVAVSLGNVLEDGLEKLFLHHPVMKHLRLGKIEGCGHCQHFRQCRGNRNASYAAYGHFFGPDPGCWLLHNNSNQSVESL